MNKLLNLMAVLFVAGFLFAAIVAVLQKENVPPYGSCIVASTNVTLIPAVPNSITILRNGKRELCYVYKDTKSLEK